MTNWQVRLVDGATVFVEADDFRVTDDGTMLEFYTNQQWVEGENPGPLAGKPAAIYHLAPGHTVKTVATRVAYFERPQVAGAIKEVVPAVTT